MAPAPPRIATGSPPLCLIAIGAVRACYEHPDDPTRCIKVPVTPRGLKESFREERYLKRVVRRYGERQFAHAARPLGRVTTTRGPGWVFERVLDVPSGRPSPTVTRALDERRYAAEPVRWQRAFDEFRDWMHSTALVVRDLTPDNLCAQRLDGGHLRLVLVDGAGPGAWLARQFPLALYARRANPRYAERRGVQSLAGLLEESRRYRRRRECRPATVTARGLAPPAVRLVV